MTEIRLRKARGGGGIRKNPRQSGIFEQNNFVEIVVKSLLI